MSTSKVSTSKELVDVYVGMMDPIESKWVEVFLDDHDVTKHCYYARLPIEQNLQIKSEVGLFKINEEGKRYLVDGYGGKNPATEVHEGIVSWRYKEDKPK